MAGSYLRCYICNNYSKTPFFPHDPDHSVEWAAGKAVCEECAWWHEDVMSDFDLKDEIDYEEDPFEYDE